MIKQLSTIAAAVAALTLGACSKTEAEFIESANTALAKNDRPAALIELKNAIEGNPNSAQARYLLGKILLSGGDAAGAVVELSKSLEFDPDNESSTVELARALLATGRQEVIVAQYAQRRLKVPALAADLLTTVAAAQAAMSNADLARTAVNQALASKPDFAPAQVALARLEAQSGKLQSALEQLEAVLAREPGHEGAGMLKAELLLAVPNGEAPALAAYRQVALAHPGSVPAQAGIIALLLRQGQLPQAKEQFSQLKRQAPQHIDTLFFEAQFAFQAGDFKRTRELADVLLKDRPGSVRVLELAGAADFSQQQYVQAEFALTKALKLAPGLLRARHLLAQTYAQLNQPRKVVEVLQPVLDGKSPDGTSLSLAGAAWLQLGDDKRADTAFKAALKVAPVDQGVRGASVLARASKGNAQAVNDLEALAAGDPTARTDLALIGARLTQKDLGGALKAIDALQAKRPDQALAYGMRGRVLLLKGDLAGASKALEQALAKDPTYYPAITSLSAIDLKNGKPDLARARLEAAIKARPKDYHGHLALAELAARTGAGADEVLQHLRNGVKASAGLPAPHHALIAQLVAAGRGKEALEAAQVAAAALPNDEGILEALGRAQMSAGDGRQASVSFKKLSAQQPGNPVAQLFLADAYLLAKDPQNAERALRQALVLQPDLLDAQRRLVALAIMRKQPADGLSLARDLQKRQPKNPWGFTLEGEVQTSQRQWEPAIAAYRQALQREASTEHAVNLQDALRRGSKAEEAEKAAGDWLKAHPKDVVYLYHLANASLVAQQDALAESRFRAVLDLQPDNALALNNLAWLLLKQGKPGALALAQKADKLLPGRAVVLDTLASALAADNQLPNAIVAQKRAADLSPADPALKLSLARLYVKSGDKDKARAQLDALSGLGDQFRGQAEVTQLLKSL